MLLQFSSFAFLFIICISFPLYWSLNGKTQIQNLFLLVLSYIVYCWITFWLGIILFISTIFNYSTGLLLGKLKRKIRRKIILYFAIVCNIAYLFLFRYFNFFSVEISNFLNLISLKTNPFTLILIIPIGISYYSLSAISYNIDIYRNDIKPTKNFVVFALFLVFFPKMIAGPIERGHPLIPQISNKKGLKKQDFSSAIQLILIGYFKKVVLADFINRFIRGLYENPRRYSSAEALIIMWLFIIQLYADFSGYTNIAQGIGKFFGINLRMNFNNPFLSYNISDIWRKWHISLTSWFRDYLYIPLGGNRKGFFRVLLNIMIIFVISGLWHGPFLTMIIWGALNGFYVVLHRIYGEYTLKWKYYQKLKLTDKNCILKKDLYIKYIYLSLSWLISFNIFAFSFIFFASKDIKIALRICKLIFSIKYDFSYEDDLYILIYVLIFSAFFVFLFDFFQWKLKKQEIFTNLHWFLRILCYIFMFVMIIIFQAITEQQPFIYEGY